MQNISKVQRINEYLNSLSDEEILKHNERQAAKDDYDFQGLKENLEKGMCYYCNCPLTHLSNSKPCFHWLLWKAKGLKKKHFPLLFEIKSFHEIDAYLRWVANCAVPLQNINDLVANRASNKVIETTTKYENLEWSFSCSQSDFQGHKDRREGWQPHYHFQMRINGNVVINYNAFHIPFKPYDEFCFAIKRGELDRMEGQYVYGAGMQAVFDSFTPEELLEEMVHAPTEENATFHMSTMLVADKGATFSGKDLALLLKEHKETGVPLAKLVRKLKNVRAQTIISAGLGVPEIAERSKHERGQTKS
jgi:hypothetical protein